MNLTNILVFAALSVVFGALVLSAGERVRQYKGWVMLVASVFAVYWLQSSMPLRNLDFWLPTASLGLTVSVWVMISVSSSSSSKLSSTFDVRDTLTTLAVVAGIVLLVALTRYTQVPITPSRPPDILSVLIGLGLIGVLAVGSGLALGRRAGLLNIPIFLIIALFVILKLDPLARGASVGLRTLTGQATDQASGLDISCLGFSYLAFRLIHVLRDRSTGKLAPGALCLSEFVSYVVFFPALTAGPIDRAERFAKDYRNPLTPQSTDMAEGGRRILIGVFKKFVLADTLAIVALNATNAAQTQSTLWTWVLVYGYAFRIFFDFSGYTDIAIGLGRFFGIKLPENFDQPYLKQNLTVFWNSWHMTLTQWFRTYYFNPLTRALRTKTFAGGKTLSPTLIILTGQISTMLLIALWHGITWNFVAWGAWHAVGLFVHSRWADYTRRRAANVEQADSSPSPAVAGIAAGRGQLIKLPSDPRLMGAVNVLLTFNFVALGWVWFALPSMDLSLAVFRRLFGVGG
jgi:D-alanyl-lipoteichoic acid acyltransferase DltB (MBOAT superfamily)